jgi:hypothetical protein
MTTLDLAIFLVAGVVGAVLDNNRVAWLMIAIWALLKSLHVL